MLFRSVGVSFTGAKVAPLILACIALDVSLQAAGLRVVGLEALEVVVGDEARAQVQELVAGAVQLLDVFAGSDHVLGDQLLFTLGQRCHGVLHGAGAPLN